MLCREVADYMRDKEGQGATCVLVAVAQSVVGAFAIKDPLKPEVPVAPCVNLQISERHDCTQCLCCDMSVDLMKTEKRRQAAVMYPLTVKVHEI